MARMPVEASEPSASPLPPCLLPSSLAHPPPPTLPPCGRMIFPKHRSQHGLSLPGEEPVLAPLLPSGKSPRALALQGEVGGGPHLSSLISFHQPCLRASCTQPLTMLCSACPSSSQQLPSACYFVDPTTSLPPGTRPLLQGLPLTPSSLQSIFHKQLEGSFKNVMCYPPA